MIPAIRSLRENDLREIGSALHAGRLTPPFTAAALQRFCSGADETLVALEMQRLADEGMRTDHLALLLKSLADARSPPPRSPRRCRSCLDRPGSTRHRKP